MNAVDGSDHYDKTTDGKQRSDNPFTQCTNIDAPLQSLLLPY